jgi:hypothetical protein
MRNDADAYVQCRLPNERFLSVTCAAQTIAALRNDSGSAADGKDLFTRFGLMCLARKSAES